MDPHRPSLHNLSLSKLPVSDIGCLQELAEYGEPGLVFKVIDQLEAGGASRAHYGTVSINLPESTWFGANNVQVDWKTLPEDDLTWAVMVRYEVEVVIHKSGVTGSDYLHTATEPAFLTNAFVEDEILPTITREITKPYPELGPIRWKEDGIWSRDTDSGQHVVDSYRDKLGYSKYSAKMSSSLATMVDVYVEAVRGLERAFKLHPDVTEKHVSVDWELLNDGQKTHHGRVYSGGVLALAPYGVRYVNAVSKLLMNMFKRAPNGRVASVLGKRKCEH